MYQLQYLKNLLAREEGQDLIEYALIIVLIIVASLVTMGTLGTNIATLWTDIAAKVKI